MLFSIPASKQVSVLTDQVEAQGEKIRDLEFCLEEHREKLNATEEMLQQVKSALCWGNGLQTFWKMLLYNTPEHVFFFSCWIESKSMFWTPLYLHPCAKPGFVFWIVPDTVSYYSIIMASSDPSFQKSKYTP